MYLAGNGLTKIANALNAEGLRTIYGNPWNTTAVARILDNEKYGGDLTLQRFFSADWSFYRSLRCFQMLIHSLFFPPVF